jgi:hypothetical protein
MRDETLALHAGIDADLDQAIAAAMRIRPGIVP